LIDWATRRARATSVCWTKHAIAGCSRLPYDSINRGGQRSGGFGPCRSSALARSTPAPSRAGAAPWPQCWSVRFPIGPRVPTLSPPFRGFLVGRYEGLRGPLKGSQRPFQGRESAFLRVYVGRRSVTAPLRYR